MNRGIKNIGLLPMIILVVSCLMLSIPAFGQDLPAPGTTINKSNIQQYKDLFPPEFVQAFTDGFGGLTKPLEISTIATQPRHQLKAYVEYSQKNKGKYKLDEEGYPSPDYTRDGQPFPDLNRDDPQFVTKLMWNFDARYEYDESWSDKRGPSFVQRKGEKVQWQTQYAIDLRFKNRMDLDPKPFLDNPSGLYKAFLFQYLSPVSLKNTMTLTYRYADPKKGDSTFLYLPSMRRVIRAEAGQRSTPIVSSISALDDFGGFDGFTADFTYKLVKEQKVLAVADNVLTMDSLGGDPSKVEDMPIPTKNWEVRDVYVIDITSKNPKYPQSIKRIYMDKDTMEIYYAVAWDRAGKLWKIFFMDYKPYHLKNIDDVAEALAGNFGVDLQFGMTAAWIAVYHVDDANFTYDDVSPASLLKRGR